MNEIVFDELTRRHLEMLRNITENKVGNIYCLGMNQNMGPIKTGAFSNSRLCYLAKLNNTTGSDFDRFHEIVDKGRSDINIIVRVLEAGEDIRVWTTNMSHTQCGLAHLCDLAHGFKSKIYILSAPEDPHYLHGITHWANLKSKQCIEYLSVFEELSEDERYAYRDLWRILKEENSNLRICKDGTVVSVPDTYYDSMIKDVMNKGYKSKTDLIGRCVITAPEYIPYDWLCYRVEVILNNGIDDIPNMLYYIRKAHKLCNDNRKALSEAAKCGCFYCERIFDTKEVYEYVPRSDTAFCPHCGIDSLIPENDKYPITPEFLKLMNEYWFGYDHTRDQLTADARAVQFMKNSE